MRSGPGGLTARSGRGPDEVGGRSRAVWRGRPVAAGRAAARVGAARAVPARAGRLLAIIPGVIAGASDADPTTLATVTVVGAASVYQLSWVVVLILPVLAIVQVIAARVGLASGGDLQSLVVSAYGRRVQLLVLVSIVAVNVVTVGADLEGAAAAGGLLTGIDWRFLVVPIALGVLALLAGGGHERVRRVLVCCVLCLVGADVASAFAAHVEWGAVAHAVLVPSVRFDPASTGRELALLGTTLTGYVYVWLTISESEAPSPSSTSRTEAAGALAGAVLLATVLLFALVASGATLGMRHQRVTTAADAARALGPIAGRFAGDVLGAGLLASALVALPVMMATTAHVLAAQLGWQRGLTCRPREAPGFYGVLAAVAVLGVAISYGGLSPVRILYLGSILGGIGTPVSLAVLVAVSGNDRLMRGRKTGRALRAAGWIAATLVSVVSLAYLLQQVGLLS